MDEGVRTLDRRSHNPELYQLSYVHHIQTTAGQRPQQALQVNFADSVSPERIKPSAVWRARQDSNLRPPA